jgi:hypothetical protein
VLQDFGAQPTAGQITDHERGEGTILVEVGAEHRACGPDAGIGERFLEPRGRQVDNRNRVADQRQRRTHALKTFRLIDCEVAGLPTRGRAQVRQVNREPLLQLARTR